jgi:CRP-like cAMP-binding protein
LGSKLSEVAGQGRIEAKISKSPQNLIRSLSSIGANVQMADVEVVSSKPLQKSTLFERSLWLSSSSLCRDRGLPREVIVAIATAVTEVTVPAGKVLFAEGNPAIDFFIVVTGTLELFRSGKTVSSVGGGDIVGEESLLAGGVHRTTAANKSNRRSCTVLCLSRSDLMELLPTMPLLVTAIIGFLGERLATLAAELREIESRSGLIAGAPVPRILRHVSVGGRMEGMRRVTSTSRILRAEVLGLPAVRERRNTALPPLTPRMHEPRRSRKVDIERSVSDPISSALPPLLNTSGTVGRILE